MEFIRSLVKINHPDPDVQRRGRLLAIVLIGLIVTEFLSVPFVLTAVNAGLLLTLLSCNVAIYSFSLWLVHRAHVTQIAWLVSIIMVFGACSALFGAGTFISLMFLSLTVIIGGLVLPPRHIWGVLMLVESGVAVSALIHMQWLADPFNREMIISVTLLLVLVALFSFLGAIAIQKAIDASQQSAESAISARIVAEGQSLDLAAQAEALRRTEQQLQDLVATLETPTVALAEGVLLAPLVGALDSQRVQGLTERLLHDVALQRVRLLVIDVAGVALIDTAVAHALTSIVQAVRLLGCQVVVTGIAPGVALTLTNLGVDLSAMRTARSPQDVLGSLGSGQYRLAHTP